MGNKNASNKESFTILSEEEIQLLLSDTSFDRDQILDWHKGFLEECPTGRMNKEKFISFYLKLYPNGRATKYCKQVFKVFDKNGSGEIDFTELMMAISVTTMGDLKKKLHLGFKLYDLDQNDKIDRSEMEKVVESIYELLNYDHKHERQKSPSELVKSIMVQFDKNNDELLTKEEFVEGCLNNPVIRELLVPYA